MGKSNTGSGKKIKSGISSKIMALIICVACICAICPSLLSFSIPSFANETKQKTVRVGWYESSYSYTDKFGRKTGMAYEYQQQIATYTGWNYEYVEGAWPELLQMLMAGEIDLLSDVSYTSERTETLLYPSLPMGTESYYIYVNPNNYDLINENVHALDGKTFAVNKGSVQETFLEEWAEKNGITIDILEISDISSPDTIDLLSEGIVDAFASLDTYARDPECVPLYKIGSSDYYFAVSKNRPDLFEELDHTLKVIQNEDPFYNQKLYQKYIWLTNTGIVFTKNECEWLSSHNTIKVGYRDNYQPFCFEEAGMASGALKDYLEYAAENIDVVPVNYEPVAFATTEEALDALQKGEIDVVFPVSMSTYDSEISNLFLTSPVMNTEIYALVKREIEKDIFTSENTKVVLLEGNVNFDNFVKDYYPNWEISWCPTLEAVYESVSLGLAD